MEQTTLTVNPDFTVPIPDEMRAKFQPGLKVAWLKVGDSYRLVRVKLPEELRGSLAGMDWSDYRDETDRKL